MAVSQSFPPFLFSFCALEKMKEMLVADYQHLIKCSFIQSITDSSPFISLVLAGRLDWGSAAEHLLSLAETGNSTGLITDPGGCTCAWAEVRVGGGFVEVHISLSSLASRCCRCGVTAFTHVQCGGNECRCYGCRRRSRWFYFIFRNVNNTRTVSPLNHFWFQVVLF